MRVLMGMELVELVIAVAGQFDDGVDGDGRVRRLVLVIAGQFNHSWSV